MMQATTMTYAAALVAALVPVAAAAQTAAPAEPAYEESFEAPADIPTKVISPADLQRLIGNTGMSLQWMNGPARGQVRVLVDAVNGQWSLIGTHGGPGDAYVGVDGFISEVGDKYFQLIGNLTILNTPDAGRTCRQFGNWRFEITQNRKYYRLRHFEWCDGLTDYIDIHF